MIGAWAEFESACVVIDAGTAVTIDALDDTGQHLGGQILPGVTLMAQALAGSTSDIPDASRRSARNVNDITMFAQNTGGAVAYGALNAVVGAIERAQDVMVSEGHSPAIVLTGGGASRILSSLSDVPDHRPHLVLQGLARMLDD